MSVMQVVSELSSCLVSFKSQGLSREQCEGVENHLAHHFVLKTVTCILGSGKFLYQLLGNVLTFGLLFLSSLESHSASSLLSRSTPIFAMQWWPCTRQKGLGLSSEVWPPHSLLSSHTLVSSSSSTTSCSSFPNGWFQLKLRMEVGTLDSDSCSQERKRMNAGLGDWCKLC